LICLQWYILVLTVKLLYVIWEKQDQVWAKIFCIPKNMYSRTPMTRRIRKGRDVTKSDACAQRTHRTHVVCI